MHFAASHSVAQRIKLDVLENFDKEDAKSPIILYWHNSMISKKLWNVQVVVKWVKILKSLSIAFELRIVTRVIRKSSHVQSGTPAKVKSVLYKLQKTKSRASRLFRSALSRRVLISTFRNTRRIFRNCKPLVNTCIKSTNNSSLGPPCTTQFHSNLHRVQNGNDRRGI